MNRMIRNTDVEMVHNWPLDCEVQGGKSGLVFVKGGEPYRTAFVEAFPAGTFIRGEGETIRDAEEAAWAKYMKRLECPGHEWEARGYKNGAGFCKHCGTFQSKVFTPEDLGLFCKVCGVPTYWSRENDDFFCEEHATDRDSEWFRNNTTGSQVGDLFGYLEAKIREEEEA